MILSLLDRYDQTGWLPTGNMLANHNIVVILDSYVKGITGFNKHKAYQAMRKNIMEPPYARRDIAPYLQYGYVPSPVEDNVTKTLEYSYNNWALAEFIKKMGRIKEYTDDYYKLLERAYYYKNIFHPAVRFMKAKTEDGVWSDGGYCEGTKWTYTWYLPHDVQGLINLMGGVTVNFQTNWNSALLKVIMSMIMRDLFIMLIYSIIPANHGVRKNGAAI